MATATSAPPARRARGPRCVTRGAVEARYRAARPDGKPHANQLDALTAMVDWLARCHRSDGERVHRSYSQIVRALERAGVETNDGTDPWRAADSVKENRRRFRHTIARRLGYLVEMGYVTSWEPIYKPNGEGAGIVVHLSADVAQLAEAPRRPRRPSPPAGTTRARRRSSSSETLHPPLRPYGAQGRTPSTDFVGEGVRRRAGAPIGRRGPASPLAARVAVALEARKTAAFEGGGVAASLAELPWAQKATPTELARAVLAVVHPEIEPRLSARWQRRLEAAVRRFDRYANFGAGARREPVGLARLIAACIDAEPPWPRADSPRSLGAIAKQLDGESKRWRRSHKRRSRSTELAQKANIEHSSKADLIGRPQCRTRPGFAGGTPA